MNLLDSGVHIEFVVTNEDKPRGRSKKPIPTEVAEVALQKNIPLFRFKSLKLPEVETILRSYKCDIYFIFAYGKLLPENIYTIPPGGTVNLHASILPLLRGASPIQSAILEGYKSTGWTLQMITEELDAGDILLSKEIAINENDNAAELTERLLRPGTEISLELINNFDKYFKSRIPQNSENATFCTKIKTSMAVIDWNQSADAIHNKIRAFNPSPVARTFLRGKMIKLYESRLPDEATRNDLEKQLLKAPPGLCLVVSEGKKRRLYLNTAKGILEIISLQPENKKIMDSGSFINGYRLEDGECFGSL